MLPVLATTLASIVASAIKSFLPETPEDKLRAIELAIQQQTLENDLIKGQLEINKTEAQSESIFKSGARPAILWICAGAFAWQFVILPLLLFISAVFHYPIVPPVFDTTEMISILSGLLGLGAMRSFDKRN